MKKIIPIIFTTALAISTVSLLVGCGGIEEDPDAVKTNTEATGDGNSSTEGSGVKGVDDNPANADFNEDGTEKKK